MCTRTPTAVVAAGFSKGMFNAASRPTACAQQVSKRATVPAVLGQGSEYFTGTVKSFNDRRGFGFLFCAETFARWGRDVYLAKVESQAALSKGEEALKEGDQVRFAVLMSEEGYPKAAGVQRVRGMVTRSCAAQGGGIAHVDAAMAQQHSRPTPEVIVQGRNSTLEKEVQVFASGCMAEHAFPADLSSDERKFVKQVADRLRLPSQSFGMGSDRCIHIFRPAPLLAPQPEAFELVEYSVKNTFIDGPMDPQQAAVGPQSLSMPADAFQKCLAGEIASSAVVPIDSLETVNESPSSSRSDTQSVAESFDSVREIYSFKNTFVHFEEADSKENADPRIIQSMPAGKFAESLQEEMAAAECKAKASLRPLALCEQALQSEAAVEMVFPQTPDADAATFQAASLAGMGGPRLDWLHSSAATVWHPAPPMCAPTAVAAPVAMPPAWWRPAAPTTNSSPILLPMTSVVVSGLTSQPGFNGLRGVISSFDAESGRYSVLLEVGAGQQRMAKLKHENLVLQGQPAVLDVAQPAPGFGSCLTSQQAANVSCRLSGSCAASSQCRPRLMLDALVV